MRAVALPKPNLGADRTAYVSRCVRIAEAANVSWIKVDAYLNDGTALFLSPAEMIAVLDARDAIDFGINAESRRARTLQGRADQ